MTDIQKQCLLTFLGYDTGGVDGIWGKKSRDAVEQCQEDLGIDADGIWGPQTEAAVLEAVYTWDDVVTEDAQTGAFWDDIEYFTRDEFKCKCGGKYCDGYPHEPQEAMVRLADSARRHFGKPAIVVSGLRCETHNANEGGVANSQHIYGEACDIRIYGETAATVLAWFLKQPGVRYAYAINGTNVHFDIPKGAR